MATTAEPATSPQLRTGERARNKTSGEPKTTPSGGFRAPRAAVITVLLLLSVGIAASWQNPGLRMDEGLLLEYPTLIGQGKVPFRDFQSSYGPGTYLPLFAAYTALGPSVTVERAVGAAYRIALVLAIVALLLPLGVAVARAGGVLAVVGTLGPGPPVAYGWYAALACVLWAIWLARRALQAADGSRWRWAASGLLLGSALTIRPDLGLIGVLAMFAVAPGRRHAARGFFAGGLGLGLAPLGVTVALAGPQALWDNLVEARLHIQPQARLPFTPLSVAMLTALVAGAMLLFATSVSQLRRGRAGPLTRCWLALSIVSLGLLPQAFQRADGYHFADVAPLVLGLLPWAVTRGRRPTWVIATAIPLLASLIVGLHATAGLGVGSGYSVSHSGRAFSVASAADARELHAILGYVGRHSSPGESIFVGPRDLRWAVSADTWLYYLMPALRPASFYLELSPGDANRAGSRLPVDLQRADLLVLDAESKRGRETVYPNARPGPATANDVVTRDFRVGFRSGPYSVWRNWVRAYR